MSLQAWAVAAIVIAAMALFSRSLSSSPFEAVLCQGLAASLSRLRWFSSSSKSLLRSLSWRCRSSMTTE